MKISQHSNSTADYNLNSLGPLAFRRSSCASLPTPAQLAALREHKVEGMNFSEAYTAIFCKGSGLCIAGSLEGLHRLVGAELVRLGVAPVGSDPTGSQEGHRGNSLLAKLGHVFAWRADQRRLGAALTAELCGRGVAEIETVVTTSVLMGTGARPMGEVLLVLKPTALGIALEESLR